MTTITAKIIADSVSPNLERLTTLQLRYPRFIHAELMTHRLFTRNASSSRAIPVSRMISDIERDPAEPIYWGANQPGMQARRALTLPEQRTAMALWREDREHSILMARQLSKVGETGAHKQLVNRLIENHGHINVVVTATEWANWFELRDHPDAQPEIAALAVSMRKSMDESVAQRLIYGQYHMPYVSNSEAEILGLDRALMVSVARCARVSYLTHDGKTPNLEDDLRLAHDLVVARPLHASPAEHQATPLAPGQGEKRWVVTGPGPQDAVLSGNWSRNFNGWKQYRVYLEHQASA